MSLLSTTLVDSRFHRQKILIATASLMPTGSVTAA